MNDSGLLHAFLLDGKGGAQTLDWAAIRHWQPDDGALWVNLDYEDDEVRHWLAKDSGLDSVLVDALQAEDTRPRCDVHSDGLLLGLRGINHNPGADAEDMVSLRIFATSQRIITARHRPIFSIRDLAEDLRRGTGPQSIGELVAQLGDRMTDRMSGSIEALEEQVASFEEQALEQVDNAMRVGLLDLRRQAIVLRRYLGPQREALQRLHHEKISWLEADQRLQIRESADRVTRYVEELDAARDRASVVYEELNSRLAEQLNSRMYLLTVVTGVFLPLGFITGLLGINVGGMPGADNPFGFGMVVLILLIIVVAELIYFRHRRWW